MTLNPCSCGLPVRLGAIRITVNRRRGVSHYIAHQGPSNGCKEPDKWTCAMVKPYPKRDEDKDWFKMILSWNDRKSP